MSFISLGFYLWLTAAAVLFYFLPQRGRAPYLLLASYAFYLTWERRYALLLLGATLLSYAIARSFKRVESDWGKAWLLMAGIVPIIGTLVFFKSIGHYSGFLLPLGVSYYTFKLVAYLLETYWDHEQVETNFIDFALFPAFAPQIVSGPIQRPGDFFQQLASLKNRRADFAQIEDGFRLILGGLMLKMLIGDRLGAFINAVDRSPADYRWPIVLTTVFCYTLQLYADFAGYTNIAIGIGKLFGIDAPPNFAAPFAATNIAEMWRRWHMSLTTWVADYLFTPLQMALRNLGTLGLVLGLTASMVVIGLWHGVTLDFLIFGLCHAVFVTLTALTNKFRVRLLRGRPMLSAAALAGGIVLTFLLMTFSQIFWHNHAWHDAVEHLELVFGLKRCGLLTWTDLPIDIADPIFPCMAIAFYVGFGAPGTGWLRRKIDLLVPNWVQYGFCLLALSALSIEAGAKFIYGQF